MRGYLSRFAFLTAVCLVAVIVALGGLVFLSMALYLQLSLSMTSALAAFVTGCVALAVAALLWLVARASVGSRARRRAPDRDRLSGEGPDVLATEAGLLLGEFLRRGRGRGSLLAAGAFAAGLVLGLSPRARRVLGDLIL